LTRSGRAGGRRAADKAALDLSLIVDDLHEGVQVIDRDFRYVYLNDVAALHGRRPAAELVGKRMQEAYPGIEQTPFFQLIKSSLEEGSSHRVENEFEYADGSKRWFELHIEAIPDGVVVLSLDITDRKNMDSHLRRAQKMEAVGQLAGGVAHDFNNLLTVIQSYASSVLKALGPGHPLSQDLTVVLSAAGSASDLTRKLLTFARQLPVEPRRVHLRQAIERLTKLAKGVIGENVELHTDVADDLAIRIDPGSLDQVLLNLVINARDAMPNGGRISISATRKSLSEEWAQSRGAVLARGVYVVVSVTDSGTGMPREVQDRVFDPFFTTKGEKGHGLGLSTCWGLIQQAGGTITVHSEEGIGTTFKLFLPHHQADASAPEEVTDKAGGGTVLLVEDQDPLRAVVSGLLKRAGYRVLEASGGKEALAHIEQQGATVDLLLSDLSMPGMTGIELAGLVRARLPRARILLMSGMADRTLDPTSLGYAHFLPKPFTPSALLGAVSKALAEPASSEPVGTQRPAVS
jgi:PAS domain S-box-containing protein